MTFALGLSEDASRLTLKGPAGDATLDAAALDDLIAALAAKRAAMTPVHAAEPPRDSAGRHSADNLLWSVRPTPDRTAIEVGMHHPGLGWLVMNLSRGQSEDLVTSVAFALQKIN